MAPPRLTSLLVWLAALSGPTLAAADPQSEARAKFREGARLFEHDHPTEARAAFEAAYAILPNPRVLANIAACWAAEGKNVEAVRTYRRFLREAGEDVPRAARRAAEAELARLHGTIGDLVISVEPEGAAVSIDGADVGRAPIEDAIALEPGAHVVEVRAEGLAPFSRRVSIWAGRETNVSVVLQPPAPVSAEPEPQASEPEPAPAPAPPPEPEARIPPLVWVGAGVTAALAIGGTVTGILTLGMKSEYEDPSTSPARRNELADSTPTLATVTDVLLDTAVVVGLATAGYWIFVAGGEQEPPRAARLRWEPVLRF